jgi:Domain of unknown function (DUF5753)/Helix-turn-helix domain
MKVVLGLELARLRKLRSPAVTQADAAVRLGCTPQKIGFIEGGSGIKLVELNALFDFYEVDEADQTYARSLQAESQRRTKRGAFSTRFPQYLRLLVDLESSCQRYFSYEATLIPGLLQTEEYMRIAAQGWRPSLSSEHIEEETRNRLGRQDVLDNTDQRFWFVIDEAALHRIGDRDTKKKQIKHLLACAERPNVELQVVPFDVGYYMGQGHAYMDFGYDTEPPVDIVYREHLFGGEYVDDPKRTPAYLALQEHHKAVAVGPEQTRRMLAQIAASL